MFIALWVQYIQQQNNMPEGAVYTRDCLKSRDYAILCDNTKLLIALELVLFPLRVKILVATSLLSLHIKQLLTFDYSLFKKFRNQLDVIKMASQKKGRDVAIRVVHLTAFLAKTLEESPNFGNKCYKDKSQKNFANINFGTHKFRG